MRIGFLKSKQKEEVFLALDIGTEGVKTLVFKREDKKMVILEVNSQYYDQFGVWDSKDFEKDVIKKAISKVLKNSEKKVILGLPASILKGRIVPQVYQRENPQKIIKREEEEEIYQTILRGTQQRVSQDFAQISGILPQELEFLDQEILEIKIDGYEVPHLQGYEGKNLEFKIFSSFAPKYYLQNFKKILEDLKLNILKITHPAQNLTDIFNGADGIFLDIGGLITQLFLVKNGKLEIIDELEIGGQNFSEILSQSLGLSNDRARVLKERYGQGLLSEGTRTRINQMFSGITREWFSNLKSKLKTLKGLPPSTVFLFGGGSLLPEIQEILTEKGNFVVKLVYSKDLKNIVDNTYTLNNPKNINLLLLAYG